MAVNTIPFDAAPYLIDPTAQAELLDEALQSGDSSYITEALAVIARARGLATTGEAGIPSDSPASFQSDPEPKLSTLLAIARDLGVRLHAVMEAAE